MLPTHLIRDTFRYELRKAVDESSLVNASFLACMLAHMQRKGKYGALTFKEALKVVTQVITPATKKQPG